MTGAESQQRLQKVLARAGIASRRACEELIRQGRVRVDGQVATLGSKVNPQEATITVDGRLVTRPEAPTYIVLHKPAGILSVMHDDRGRPDLSSLVTISQRVYPVGRLDQESEGLILLTNDGEVAHRLTHPRFGHRKTYLVLVDGEPEESNLERVRRGVVLEGRRTRAAQVRRLESPPREAGEAGMAMPSQATWLAIVLREGRKRQIREMCQAVGHPVRRLIRVRLGPLRLGSLTAGQWRELTEVEIEALRKAQRPPGGR